MQFTAVHGEWGRVDVTLPDLGVGRSWEAIHRVRGIELTCPECGGQVFAPVSQLGNQHLYHRIKPPSCSLANESLEHHLLKLELVTLARAAGFRAELEVGDPAGLWRADVMVFDQDGGWLMALEVQLSPITVEDIKHRTSRYARDGVRVCWFGLQPRPWAGSVPTLLVDLPESRDAAWKVTAGLARFSWNPAHPDALARWVPAGVTLADAVAWVLRGKVVPHRATRHSNQVSGPVYGEWPPGWTGSWNHSWRVWWTAPAYTALAYQHAQHVEEEERREREAAKRREERERLEAIRQAEQERERAKKRAAKDRAYKVFWARTGMNQAYWRIFANLLIGHTGRELVFGMPDPSYGNGRPAFRCTDAGAIATSSRHGERAIMNDTHRVLTALKLETDESLPLADRVAGCLVLQYGQSTDRIVNITLAQVHIHPDEPGVLGLQLGRETLWLRPRLSALLQRLIRERRPLSAPLKGQETPYLFPGLRPSRPLSTNTLQRRLQRLGVPSASKARNGAWLALVGAVHWKMLADLLGTADGTAHHWHKWNGGDRASYVASRLRAAQAPTSPE